MSNFGENIEEYKLWYKDQVPSQTIKSRGETPEGQARMRIEPDSHKGMTPPLT